MSAPTWDDFAELALKRITSSGAEYGDIRIVHSTSQTIRGEDRRIASIRDNAAAAFIQAKQGLEIGEAIARRGIKKQYYLETRGDVLLRNKEVFKFWKTIGLQYMFIGVEAIDKRASGCIGSGSPSGRISRRWNSPVPWGSPWPSI